MLKVEYNDQLIVVVNIFLTFQEGALGACSKIFDKAGGASKDEMGNIAKSVVGVIGNAMSAATTEPVNGTSNSSQVFKINKRQTFD